MDLFISKTIQTFYQTMKITPFYELKIKDFQLLKCCSATTAVKIKKRIVEQLVEKGFNNPNHVTIFRYAHLEGESILEVIKALQ